jgi:hypothetical protein
MPVATPFQAMLPHRRLLLAAYTATIISEIERPALYVSVSSGLRTTFNPVGDDKDSGSA